MSFTQKKLNTKLIDFRGLLFKTVGNVQIFFIHLENLDNIEKKEAYEKTKDMAIAKKRKKDIKQNNIETNG